MIRMRNGGSVRLGVGREWFLRVMLRFLRRGRHLQRKRVRLLVRWLLSLPSLVRGQYRDRRVLLLLNLQVDRTFRNLIWGKYGPGLIDQAHSKSKHSS